MKLYEILEIFIFSLAALIVCTTFNMEFYYVIFVNNVRFLLKKIK